MAYTLTLNLKKEAGGEIVKLIFTEGNYEK